MQRYLARRAISTLIVLVGVSFFAFFLVRLTGDPVLLMLGPDATPELIAQTRQNLGLDQPLSRQFVDYLARVVVGDFGTSLYFRIPAMQLVIERFPATLLLTGVSVAAAIVLALPLGIFAAIHRTGRGSHLVMAFSLLGQAIPVFWLGIVLQLFFSVELGWLPPFGAEGLSSLILPAATLTPWVLARLVRLVRSSMLDVLSENYIQTARGKGLHEGVVVYKHALRNAGLPIVTMVGIMFGYLLGGAVLTETIFAWPGVGLLVVESIFRRDFPVVQAAVFLVAIGVILINLGVDMLYAVLDPQIRYS